MGSDQEKVLRGVVRIEHVSSPEDYIPEVLERVKRRYLERTYKIFKWENHMDFLEQIAKKSGRLLKGGEPDINAVSKMVLNDWQRGKLPYFVPPIGCMKMPTVPAGNEDDDTVEANEDDIEEDAEAEEEDELEDSDTETVDTVATNDTTETVDSLFENVKFSREDKLEAEHKVRAEKKAKPQVDLRELVKQDFKKIVSSIDFFEEEKYEGGKREKKTTSASISEDGTSKTNELRIPSESEAVKDDSDQTASEETEVKDDSGKRVVKANKRDKKKKIKTGAGTFNVSSS